MKLSDEQLIMLNQIMYTRTYFGDGKPLRQTVADVREHFSSLAEEEEMNWFFMSRQEISLFLDIIEKSIAEDHHFGELIATHTVNRDTADYGTIVTYVNPEDYSEAYVVFAGSGKAEWGDNGEGAFLSDTECQRDAFEYILALPKEYGKNITVTGHSKGGNKAMYVTVLSDRISRCLSIDGQGFSDLFLGKYHDLISERMNKITSLSCAYDYVHTLLNPVAAETLLVAPYGGASGSIAEMHKPNILLDADGSLMPYTEDAWHVEMLHKKTNEIIDLVNIPAQKVLSVKKMVTDIKQLFGKPDKKSGNK